MSEYFQFMPARLVKGRRWYVEFYQTNPVTMSRERIREYCQMNRIKDLSERQNFGIRYINELNTKMLPYGYPYVEIAKLPAAITVQTAVDLAYKIKCRSDRAKTGGTYGTVVKYFMSYVVKVGREHSHVKEFSFRDAMMFMDHMVLDKKIKARTYNNYRMFLTSLWNELIERGYIAENPWARVKKQKATDKSRLMLSNRDAQIILDDAHRTHKMIFLSIMLLYYCFIRPEEQRRMRVHMIDLKNGSIYLPGDITKNKKSEMITIPKAILPYLYEVGLDRWHRNDFIFGSNLQPHPIKQCGANALNLHHKKIIDRLYQEKKLHTISGISLYSWKDTGAMALIRSGIDAYEVMRQMRHSDLSTTQKYLKSLSNINKNIRDLTEILLPS
jgi:integrase/recombinase XerD